MNYLQSKLIPSSVDGRIAKLWLNVIRQVGLMTMYLIFMNLITKASYFPTFDNDLPVYYAVRIAWDVCFL